MMKPSAFQTIKGKAGALPFQHKPLSAQMPVWKQMNWL
jgi:hypothetical protein